jgi:hypothetical protein
MLDRNKPRSMTQGLLEEQAEDPTQSNIDSTSASASSSDMNGVGTKLMTRSTVVSAILLASLDDELLFRVGNNCFCRVHSSLGSSCFYGWIGLESVVLQRGVGRIQLS